MAGQDFERLDFEKVSGRSQLSDAPSAKIRPRVITSYGHFFGTGVSRMIAEMMVAAILQNAVTTPTTRLLTAVVAIVVWKSS